MENQDLEITKNAQCNGASLNEIPAAMHAGSRIAF